MIRVAALKPGDKIGIAAPASPFDRKLFDAGLAQLTAMGFDPVVDEEVYARDRHLAGKDEQRARHLMALFEDPTVRAIACARGGFGSMRLLPFLDIDSIRQHPKALIGFSDVTALLNVLLEQSAMPTIHGPVITALGRANALTCNSLNEVLGGRLNPVTADQPVTLSAGSAAGVLCGGNLSTLCHLVGTDFDPRFHDRIVLLEDVNEMPYRIDRMLSQMRMAGCFDGVQAIALGRFHNCGSIDDIHQVFLDHFGRRRIPIMSGFPVGHGEPNLTLALGVPVALDTEEGLIRYLESPFTEGD